MTKENKNISKITNDEKLSIFSVAIKQSKEAIAIADLKGRIIFTNTAWIKMHGYKSTKELLGVNLAIFHSKRQLNNEVLTFNKKVKKRGTYSSEVGHITKDGKEFITLMTSTLLKNKNGKPFALLGIAKDISKNKEVERKLKVSEEKFRTLIEFTYDWEYWVDKDFNFIYVSPSCKRITGYTPEEFYKDKELYKKIIHPDDKKVVTGHRHAIKDGLVRQYLEFRIITRKKEVRWISHYCQKVTNGKKVNMGRRGSNRDVTERKKIEEALKKSQENIKREKEFTDNAINSQRDTFFVFNSKTGEAIRWNKTFKNISGYSQLEIKKLKAPKAYYGLEDLKKAGALIKKVLKGETILLELELITKNGKKILYEYSASLLKEDGNNLIVAIGRDISEHKKAEDALQKTNELIKQERNLFISGVVVIFKWRNKKRWPVESVTPNVKDITGYTAEEFKSGTVSYSDIIFKEDIKLVGEEVLTSSQNNSDRFIHKPYRIVRKDGKIIWIKDYTTIIRDKTGIITHYLGYILDITKEKKAEEVIKESENRFRVIFESANDAIFLMKEKFIDCNPAGLKMFACKYDQIVGHSPIEFSPLNQPEGRKSSIKAKQKIKLALNGKAQRFYWQHKKFDGTLFDAEVSLNRVILTNDVYVQATVRDISRQKKAEDKIKQINQELKNQQEAILNVVDDLAREKEKAENYLRIAGNIIIILDRSGKIKMINKRGYEILGYKEKELIGKDWFGTCCLPQDNIKEVKSIFKKLIAGEVSAIKYYENSIISKDGQKKIIAWHNSLLKDELGNAVGILASGEDMTKIKEIDKAKTEFVSLASHQLRTPLTAIHWYSGMLLNGDKGELNEGQKKYLKKIHISNVRMTDLINALLNVSRLELGTFAIDTSMVDIVDIAKSVIGELVPEIRKKEIILKKQFDKKIPKKIKLDKRLMRIIIQNILSNAIKYTPKKGKVSIKIVRNGQNIKITISDNGYGIPRTQQKEMFTKLFRADNIKTKDTDGTGLGLYIVKSILDNIGGKVWFKSQENKGSKFYVTFPLKGIKSKKGTRKLEYIK